VVAAAAAPPQRLRLASLAQEPLLVEASPLQAGLPLLLLAEAASLQAPAVELPTVAAAVQGRHQAEEVEAAH